MAQFEYTFPQDSGTGAYANVDDGDANDAANFGALIGSTAPVSTLVRGISFTVDYANDVVSTSGGKVYLVGDSITAASSSADLDDVGFVNGVPAKTGLALTASAVNHVYVASDPATKNSPRIVINDTGSEPSDPSVKIGEIDTNNDTKSEQWNLVAGNGMLTYPDNTALTASASRFANGVPLFDRSAETISVVDSSGVSEIGGTSGSTTSVSDNGTTSVSDVSDINFDSNISVSDDGDGTVTVTGSSSTDTTTDVSDGGSQVAADVTDINFGSNVSVTDDGDGTVTVDATSSGSFDSEQWVRNNAQLRTPIVALEPGESYEIPVFIPDTKTVKLYEANAVLVGESSTGGFTTDANLVAEIVDETGTVQYSNSGLNASADGSTLYSEGNSSGGKQLWKVRVNNTDGSATFNSPGAIGSFSVVVE